MVSDITGKLKQLNQKTTVFGICIEKPLVTLEPYLTRTQHVIGPKQMGLKRQ